MGYLAALKEFIPTTGHGKLEGPGGGEGSYVEITSSLWNLVCTTQSGMFTISIIIYH